MNEKNEIVLTNTKLSGSALHRLASLMLALVMALSLLPAFTFEAGADYSDPAMDQLLNWGVVSGYPDGGLHPERSLTRAEFVAMVNRAYGFKEMGNTPFIDVPADAWFHDDINIAYTAKYFNGVSPRMAAPDKELTREQAMVLLARNLRLDPIEGEVTEFADGHSFADWSRGYARAAKQAGIVGGYTDGSYKPQNNITRGEMAVMLQRSLGTLINQSGSHTLSDVYGNVTISAPNTLLKDSTIAGDLYITGGLNLGDVTLQNVRVLGSIIVAGGGESQSGESVILRNVQADSIKVDSIADQYVSLAAEGDTVIGEAILRSDAYMQDRTRPGEGFLNITLDSVDPNATFTLSGNLESVVNKTPNSTLNIAVGTVEKLIVDEEARSSTLNLDINSTAMNLNLDTGVKVMGVGDIEKLNINAPGANVEMLPDSIAIRPGLVAEIAGQTMNAQQAKESSSDPRLLAGYPKVKNIAPKEATGVYSANKGGTVYWAVSSTIDGSVAEEELISPTKDNKKVTVTGSTPIELSETEYTSKLDKLTPDSNYYLSTVLVDARGRHSPVKVASFLTPDDTDPKFSQGYPVVMKNYCESITVNGVVQRDENAFPKRNYRVQIASMPTKTCQLYYALYPKGSTAPTAQQFRSGGIGTPISSGVEDATKNRINYIELSGLEELTEYDIYLCYIDADGSRSSPVQKLSFKTVDGKPPRFQYETPAVTQEQLTGLRLSVNVNEAARVYWVASKDNNYIKTNDSWSETEWWERACRQIESGTNGIRSGNITVGANTEATLNISGLEPATHYYIYFVAKDNAGNYSEFFRIDTIDSTGQHPELTTLHNKPPYVYYLRASTLDNIPPEARQEFTHYDAADKTKPYADTDIKIIFSEPVMQYSTHRDKAQENFQDLYTLYTNIAKAQAEGDTQKIQEAKEVFYNTLRTTIKLYNNAATGNDSVVERDDAYVDNDINPWVIDYRKATVEYDADTGEMTVVFHSDPEHPELSALNLSSGSTYHFILDDLCDTSSSKNRMGRYPLPDFTTISAQVQLRTINVTNVNYFNNYHVDSPVYGNSKTENIPIDMAFSLTPISTSVEDGVDWDMIFWSDTSCEFEVYELSANRNAADAVAIRPLDKSGNFTEQTNGHYSVSQTVENIEKPDADTNADNYKGYIGQSYFNKFYGVSGTFPSVTGKGNGHKLADYSVNPDVYSSGVMQRNVSKYYGIHITKVGTVNEEEGRGKIWDASISFRISVVTGASGDLDDLSKVLRDSTIRDFEASRGVSLIHSPKPFTLHKRFANQDAPEFATNYPDFTPKDVSVDMTVMLERPGTLYYAIVPASQWHTRTNGETYITYSPGVTTKSVNNTPNGAEIKYHTGDLPTGDSHRYYTVLNASDNDLKEVNIPINGSDTIVPAYDPKGTEKFDKTTLTSKMELESPASQAIYSLSLGNTTGVKVGSVALGSGREIVTVEGLQPETVYLAYFSMQGTGQAYSDRAQIFQFTTTKISRPWLNVTGMTTSVAITSTNMPATVDTGLFLMEDLEKTPLLSQKLTKVLDAREASAFDEYRNKYNDGTGHNYGEDTVWEAMITPFEQQGSFFDRFASEDAKNAVASLIRTSTQAGTRLDGTIGAKLEKGAPKEFAYEKTMQAGLRYILLAVARGQETATGHSLGFGAFRPLYKSDDGKPTITAITGEVTVDYQKGSSGLGGFKMSGFITLTFDRSLYLYYEAADMQSLPRRDPLTGSALSAYFIDPDTTTTSFFAKNSSSPSAVSTVGIDLAKLNEDGSGGVQNNATFTVNPKLCGQLGSPRQGQPLIVRLSYDPNTEKVTAVVMRDADYPITERWFPNGESAIVCNLIAPDATDFRLDSTSLSLNPGTDATVTATLIPTGAAGRVEFNWQGETIGNIVKLSDTSVRVVGGEFSEIKYGTLTATLYDSKNQLVTTPGIVNPKTVAVTVTPKKVASIIANPNQVTLSASAGGSARITLSVTQAPGLTDDDRRISSDYEITNSGNNKLVVQVSSTGGDTATVYINPKSGYVPQYTETIIITFHASSTRIQDATVEVELRP